MSSVTKFTTEDIIATDHLTLPIITDANESLVSKSNGDIFYNETTDNITYTNGTDLFTPSGSLQIVIVGNRSPYQTIQAGITKATSLLPGQVIIRVSPGIYTENNPIVIPSGVSIVSSGGRLQTQIVAQNPGSNLLELGVTSEISGFTFTGTTQQAVVFDGSVGTGIGSIIKECTVIGCTNGFLIQNTPGELIMYDVLIRSFTGIPMTAGITVNSGGVSRIFSSGLSGQLATFTNGLTVSGVGSLLVFRGGGIQSITNGLVIDNGGQLETDSVFIRNCDKGFVIQGLNTPSIKSFGTIISDSTTYDIDIISTAAIIKFSGGDFRSDLIHNPNNVSIQAYFFSDTPSDQRLQIIGELHVGTTGQPSESVFGEGDSTVRDMVILTDDGTGTNFVNISTNVANPSVNVPLFQGTGNGNVLYIGGPFMFYNLKINTTTAWGVGDSQLVSIEYFTGTWDPLVIMVTKANSPYDTRITEIFERNELEQVRFGQQPGWITTTVNAISNFWIRIRITSGPISSIPINGQIKIGPNRAEINEDGYREYFGKARVVDRLPWDMGLVEPANASPANGDVYIADNLAVGRKENQFNNGAIDRSGFNSFLPPNLDTSYPVKFRWAWASNVGGGDVDWVIRWGFTNDTGGAVSNIFIDAASAPATGPNEQMISFTSIAPVSANQQQNEEVLLDVSQLNPQPASRNPDIFWLTIQRTGNADTNTGDVRVIQVEGRYVKWNDGGSIDLF